VASTLARYLAREGSTGQLPVPRGRYRFVLTVPAFDEPPDFPARLLARVRRTDVLSIITVNAPDDADPAALVRTRALLGALADLPDLLVIDRVSEPVPRRQGVGLARKLAGDLACALIERGDVACPLIFMTDADATLPADYFDAGAAAAGTGTLVYPYRHRAADPAWQQRADLYELHLRHYVRGITRAGSAYAYQTLGSTIAMHAGSYAAVRGVPRRNAAEDFYLLNKAAKVAPVISLATPVIELSGRPSNRVPFGTGPALRAMPADPEAFASYPPAAFDSLAGVLIGLQHWALSEGPLDLDAESGTAVATLGWNPYRLVRQHPPGTKRLRAVLEWFDGFRTMRFIRLRQAQLPPAPLLATLRTELAMPEAAPAALLEALRSADTGRISGVAPALETAVAPPT
jgi:hypothetical protein